MNITTRTLIAIPMATAALTAGATAAMAQPAGPVLSNLDIAQPQPQPEPHPQPAGPLQVDLPIGQPDPDDDPGPDGPDDIANPDHDDDDDGDNDDGDNDDGDNDDGDNDDGDKDGGNDVRRPTRVDAGSTSDGSLSISWLLGSGAMITAAGGFTARRAALKRR